MAKSLRATRTKNNKTRLRKTIFEKVEKERSDRLSAKLMEIANAPKPSKNKDADMDITEAEAAERTQGTGEQNDAMALDKPKVAKKPSTRNAQSRIGKRRKTSKGIVFPVGKKHSLPKSQGRKR